MHVTAMFKSAANRHDPWWDLEGAGARRLRRMRHIEALMAWLGVVAVSLLAVVGAGPIEPLI
jgi:hypothetical protein